MLDEDNIIVIGVDGSTREDSTTREDTVHVCWADQEGADSLLLFVNDKNKKLI